MDASTLRGHVSLALWKTSLASELSSDMTTVILEVTSKSGGVPFCVVSFFHEDLIGLRESLPCIPVVGSV